MFAAFCILLYDGLVRRRAPFTRLGSWASGHKILGFSILVPMDLMIVSNIYNRLKSLVRDSHCIPETPDGSGGGLLIEDDDNYRQRPFVKTLDNVTELRRNFVARLKILDPLVESNLIIHLFAISLLLWIWGISLARAHTLTLFSFHPVFMSMGCVLFMTEGILAYRNHACFQFLSPIMRNSARVKLQNIHRGFHILAAVCVAMGMAFIFSNKVKKHRTILPTSIHAALGFLVCALMVLQMIAGLEKLDAQRSGVIGGNGRDGGGVLHRWHGKAGLILYDVAMATVATGLVKSLGFGLITFLMVLHVCLVWFMVHLQMGSKPFRPTEDGGLTDRELIELRREGGCDGGDEKGEKGRGSKGNFVPRKDSGDFTDPI